MENKTEQEQAHVAPVGVDAIVSRTERGWAGHGTTQSQSEAEGGGGI